MNKKHNREQIEQAKAIYKELAETLTATYLMLEPKDEVPDSPTTDAAGWARAGLNLAPAYAGKTKMFMATDVDYLLRCKEAFFGARKVVSQRIAELVLTEPLAQSLVVVARSGSANPTLTKIIRAHRRLFRVEKQKKQKLYTGRVR